jgi:lipid-A-disaccharide synthase
MTAAGFRIAMVAGEASGDLLASQLIQALRARLPNAVFYGVGGPKMLGMGFEAWHPLEKLAVRGYVEVLRHYREIAAIRRDLKRRFLADPPDVFIGVDAPDFNLALEKALKQRGIPSIHYVSPSIWAWRGTADPQDWCCCFAGAGALSIRTGAVRAAGHTRELRRPSLGRHAAA